MAGLCHNEQMKGVVCDVAVAIQDRFEGSGALAGSEL